MTGEQETWSRITSMAPVAVADQLKRELAQHGITTDVNNGYGLAVVSVWLDLVVWTNGDLFWWRAGWNDQRTRAVYACHSTADPERAARRIAARYGDLRRSALKRLRPTSGPVPFWTGDPA